MGTIDIYPIAVNVQMLLEILNWIGIVVYGAAGSTTVTAAIRALVGASFLIGMVSAVLLVLTSGGREKTGPLAKHMVMALFVVSTVFSLPMQLRIHDTILEEVNGNPNIAWTTGNIPAGVGLPLFLATLFEYQLTSLIDNTFTENFVPVAYTGDADYLKLSVGGGVGAVGNMMLGLHTVSAQDPRLVVNTMSFVKECVMPAVALKILPPATLANADDLLAAISNNLLLNYYADYEQADGTIITLSCDNFYNNQLSNDITAAQASIQSSFVRAGFNSKRLAPGAVSITGSLLIAAQSTMRSSFNNPALSGNSVILNAWVGRMVDLAVAESLGGGDPLIQAMSERVREFKAERSVAGLLALTWLPKIKGALLCVLCALFIPITPFILFYGNRILISWGAMLVWLSLWGVMLAIINGMWTHDLINTLINVAPATSGASTMTFGNRFAIWNAAAESLAGMGMVVSWVIPLSGIIMGWLSSRGFSGAGASHAVESQINRGSQGAAQKTVTSESAARYAEGNISTMAMGGGGKFGMSPDLVTNSAWYNFGQQAGRADAHAIHGMDGLKFAARGDVDARLGGTGGNELGNALSVSTEMNGWNNQTAGIYRNQTSGASARLEKSGGMFAREQSNATASIAAIDNRMAKHMQDLARGFGISHQELQQLGQTWTGDASWSTDSSKTRKVTNLLNRGYDGAQSFNVSKGSDGQRSTDRNMNAGLSLPGDVVTGLSAGAKYGDGSKKISRASMASAITEKQMAGWQDSSQKGEGTNKVKSILSKVNNSILEKDDISSSRQKSNKLSSSIQESLSERKQLEDSANENMGLQKSFNAAVGLDLKDKLFKHFVALNASAEGYNLNNAASNPGHTRAATNDFMDTLYNNEKSADLLKSYLKQESPLSDTSVDKAFSYGNQGGMAPNTMSVEGADKAREKAENMSTVFNAFENTTMPIANSMKDIKENLHQAGVSFSHKSGHGELFQNTYEAVMNTGSIKEAEAVLGDKISGLSDQKGVEIAKAAHSLASLQKSASVADFSQETIAEMTNDPKNPLSYLLPLKDLALQQGGVGVLSMLTGYHGASETEWGDSVTPNDLYEKTKELSRSFHRGNIIDQQQFSAINDTAHEIGERINNSDQVISAMGLSAGLQESGIQNLKDTMSSYNLSDMQTSAPYENTLLKDNAISSSIDRGTGLTPVHN